MNEINWQAVNIVVSLVNAVGSLLIALYAWRKREVQGALRLLALVAAVGWVALLYAFEAAAGTDLNTYLTFTKIEYLALPFLPVLWLLFALTFSGRERAFSTPVRLLLFLPPLISTLLALTNEWHGLIYREPRFEIIGGAPVYSPIYGTWFWIHLAYSYVIFVIGSIVLIRRALGDWKLYRAQAALVFVGTTLPWISNIFIIFDQINPLPNLYLNAIFLCAAMVCFTFAVFRLRLLDIMPLAYDTILNNVPDGLMVVDKHSRIVALNEYIKPFMDDPTRDPIGLPLENVFSRYAVALKALRDTFDYKGQYPVGNIVAEIRISPVVNRRGQRQGRLFVFRDVTARVQFEQVQRDEKVFAETMREIGSTLNSTLDTNRVLSLILESAERLAALSHANIMLIEGETTRIRQHRGYSPEAITHLEAMAFDYRTYPTFARAAKLGALVILPDTAQDPEWKVVETLEDVRSFACMPIQSDGELIGFINLESAMPGTLKPEMASRLQIFAQQAAAAINNARLYEKTRHQAEELETLYERVSRLETLKSDMIRVAAHDLRNPLGVVMSGLEFLTNPDLKANPDQLYPIMKRSAERMNEIIHDFLSLDRIARIAEQQTMTPFDLRQVVSKAMDEYSGQAAQKGQALEAKLPDDGCMVQGDSAQVYEALTNLISNAIKYTAEAGHITVSLACEQGSARLEVVDTGYGIPDTQQEQIFQPFFRADTQETRQIEGVGLGLHLAKNIIERQGGTLLFHSVYGEGSTFGFQLPVYPPVKAEPPDFFG